MRISVKPIAESARMTQQCQYITDSHVGRVFCLLQGDLSRAFVQSQFNLLSLAIRAKNGPGIPVQTI